MAAGAVIALLVLALLAVVVYAWYLRVKLSKLEGALVRAKKLETRTIARRKLRGEAASTPTRGHDALGQVPCEAARGSQICRRTWVCTGNACISVVDPPKNWGGELEKRGKKLRGLELALTISRTATSLHLR